MNTAYQGFSFCLSNECHCEQEDWRVNRGCAMVDTLIYPFGEEFQTRSSHFSHSPSICQRTHRTKYIVLNQIQCQGPPMSNAVFAVPLVPCHGSHIFIQSPTENIIVFIMFSGSL